MEKRYENLEEVLVGKIKAVDLEATDSLTFRVGENYIIINKDGIKIQGKRLDLNYDTP